MKLRAALLILVAAVTSSGVSASQGCPFLGKEATLWEQAAHYAKSYNLIFEGTLESQTEPEGPGPEFLRERTYRFQVLRSYKGSFSTYYELQGTWKLKTGATYLVFLGSMIPCPLYFETKDAPTELRFLRGEGPQPGDLITSEAHWLQKRKPNAGQVCGRIHGYPNQPQSEQLFRLWFKKDGEWDWPTDLSMNVNANGDYCLSGVDPGEYVLTLTIYDRAQENRFVGMTDVAESLEGARPFPVRPHQKTAAPDLFLRKEPMFVVRGSVVLDDGRIPNVSEGSILVRLDRVGDSPFDICPSAHPDKNGEFEIHAVRAGDYVLRGWYSASEYAEDGNTLLWKEEAEVELPLSVGGNLQGLHVVMILEKPN